MLLQVIIKRTRKQEKDLFKSHITSQMVLQDVVKCKTTFLKMSLKLLVVKRTEAEATQLR